MSAPLRWIDKGGTQIPLSSNEFETPDYIFEHFNKEFNFTWDLAARGENHKVEHYISPDDNSLIWNWHELDGWLWLNPPYSPLKVWVEKAQQEFLKGAKICMLIPPILTTKYFSQVTPSEIRLILGRIPFIGADGIPMKANSHDSCLVVYGPPVQPKVTHIKIEKG